MIINIAEPSVKSLLIHMQVNGKLLGSGTGFIVQSNVGPVLVTNRHNVTGRHQKTGEALSKTGGLPDELIIFHNRKNKLGEWVKISESIYESDKPRWIEHPAHGAQADIAAMPLLNLDDVQIYPYDLKDTGPKIKCGPSDIVSVVGFPFGITAGGSLAIWATGFVASEPDINYLNLPIFLIDCRSRPGQSGSAVIAYRSGGLVALEDNSAASYSSPVTRFLGIYSGRINNESDIGYVWKVSAIQELVNSITKTN